MLGMKTTHMMLISVNTVSFRTEMCGAAEEGDFLVMIPEQDIHKIRNRFEVIETYIICL